MVVCVRGGGRVAQNRAKKVSNANLRKVLPIQLKLGPLAFGYRGECSPFACPSSFESPAPQFRLPKGLLPNATTTTKESGRRKKFSMEIGENAF